LKIENFQEKKELPSRPSVERGLFFLIFYSKNQEKQNLLASYD